MRIINNAIDRAHTSSSTPEDLGLGFNIHDDFWPDVLISLCIPYFYLSGGSVDQNRGVTFSIYSDFGKETLASGGYTFPPNTPMSDGRLPINLTAVLPGGGNRHAGPSVSAKWCVLGDGVTAHIDSPSTLTALLADEVPPS